MLVPTISYSPMAQFSAQREPGVMLWGKVFENRMQYQAGVFNGVPDSYYDFDRNKDFVGSLTFTPFKANEDSPWRDFGFGVSTQTGWQDYMLDRVEEINFIAGAGTPRTGQQYVTSSGIPFFYYNTNVRSLGNRTRVAPHIFYYNRFSLLAEFIYQGRELADPYRRGYSTQRGFYVQTSHFPTGERNTGDGTGGFPTIIPNRPFNPTQGECGLGAWEIPGMYTYLDVGRADIQNGFASPNWATRLNEVQLGVNWWPNKYVRVSLDWVYDKTNQPFPWPVNDDTNGQRRGPANPIDQFNVIWTRVAFFF